MTLLDMIDLFRSLDAGGSPEFNYALHRPVSCMLNAFGSPAQVVTALRKFSDSAPPTLPNHDQTETSAAQP